MGRAFVDGGQDGDVPAHCHAADILHAADGSSRLQRPRHVLRRTTDGSSAEGAYQLGDHDTKEDGIRMAVEVAKGHALEQVPTYVESVTTSTALDITRDEILTYTAGVVRVSEQAISTRLDDNQIIIHADLTVQIDPEESALAVITLRQNDDARQQLQLLTQEVKELHQQLDLATTQLAAATSPEHVSMATQQRQDLLNRVQSDDALAQAGTDWALVSPTASPYPWIGVSQAQRLWAQAALVYPANPHLVVLQRFLPVASPTRTVSPTVSAPITTASHARTLQSRPPRVSAAGGNGPPAFSGHLPSSNQLPPAPSAFSPRAPSWTPRQHAPMPHYSAPRSGGGGHGHGRGGLR
jgi:hypothetical protein